MALLHLSSILILLSIILISTTPLATCQIVTDADIQKLCSKTSDPGTCYRIVKSDRRTANVDAKGLVGITVDLASFEGKKIKKKVDSLSKTIDDPKSKSLYGSCLKEYSGAVSDLQGVLSSLKSGVYDGVLGQLNDAIKDVEQCERAYGENVVSDDRAYIRLKNQEFQLMLEIVRAAAENLKERKFQDEKEFVGSFNNVE